MIRSLVMRSLVLGVMYVAAQGTLNPARAQDSAIVSECARAQENTAFFTDRYKDLVCAGESALKNRRLDGARTNFIRALLETLTEIPNYAPILSLAEVECLRNASDEGPYLLNEFECMLDVEIGRRQCFLPQTDDRQNETISNSVSYMCFERMCSELYLSYYENRTPATLDWVRLMRGEVRRISELCQ